MAIQEWEERTQILIDEAGRDCSLEDYIERLDAMKAIIDIAWDAAQADLAAQEGE